MTLNPDDFSTVCFLVLMQSGVGVIDKHIDYIREKSDLLAGTGYDAFGVLDIHNMNLVADYHKKWGLDLPEQVADYLKEANAAWDELKARGVEL